jgi:hypothetical protein
MLKNMKFFIKTNDNGKTKPVVKQVLKAKGSHGEIAWLPFKKQKGIFA